MPFDDKFNDIYRLGIKDTASSLNIVAQRVDEQIYHEGILEQIYRQIEAADIIIADMTGKNPNVFYEAGYAHAKKKITILLTDEAYDIPFDLKHRRHIVYKGSISKLRTALTEELQWAKKEIDQIQRSHIKVRMNTPIGFLEKSKYSAEGLIYFTIDLSNESEMPSPEIDQIFFYTTASWRVKQENKDCSATNSDLPEFEKRHLLTSPVQRLRPGGWAQLKFTTSKILAFTFQGDEIKDEYNIIGRSVLRFVTAAGNFDHKLAINVTVDDLPF